MGRKKVKPMEGSGEQVVEEVIIPDVQQGIVPCVANPLQYINNAVPKLRATLLSTGCFDGDPEDLEIIKTILKKDRIKSGIYDFSDSEDVISDAMKNSCVILVNSPEQFKAVATRAFLSGRYIITWFPELSSDITEEEKDYYHSSYCLLLRNISEVPQAVRKCRSSYTDKTVQEIREFILSRVEYT